eukprot:m.188028 g.188028  ORF g.188028 m.188028 type:complete len:623 (+) comp24807_c0_seq1:63-1931(+)
MEAPKASMEVAAQTRSLFEFDSSWPEPDPVATDYHQVVASRGHPAIVIDNSAHCRVGWAGDTNPRLSYPNITAKPKVKKGVDEISIGNGITEKQFTKWVVTGPHEQGVATNFDVQEKLLDHAFAHLGIDTDQIEHPIVMTEALCCPGYSRAGLTEMLLEGYTAPSVAYGVPDLFSHMHNRPEAAQATGLVVSLGYESTSVMPVLGGRLDSTRSSRIELGGFQFLQTMYKLIQLKRPGLGGLTYPRIRQLVDKHTYFAADYGTELDRWADPLFARQHNVCVQMPFDADAVTAAVDSTRETAAELERRHEGNALRLKDMHRQRRQGKLQNLRPRVRQLQLLRDEIADLEEEESAAALVRNGIESIVDLNAELAQSERDLEQMEDKVRTDTQAVNPTVPARKRMRLTLTDERRRKEDPDQWLRDVRSERRRVTEQIERSAVTELTALGDTDELPRLARELDELLHEHEAGIVRESRECALGDLQRKKQVTLDMERVRVPEVLFQPHIIGSATAGLGEVLERTFAQFSQKEADQLAANVFVTGQEAKISGAADRIRAEIRGMRPADTEVRVFAAADPGSDGWRGASAWANRVDLSTVSITRDWYLEHGPNHLVEHVASNQFLIPKS